MDIRSKPNTDVFFALATAIGLVPINTQAKINFTSLMLVTKNGTYNTTAILLKINGCINMPIRVLQMGSASTASISIAST
jgi:hypothetical protein